MPALTSRPSVTFADTAATNAGNLGNDTDKDIGCTRSALVRQQVMFYKDLSFYNTKTKTNYITVILYQTRLTIVLDYYNKGQTIVFNLLDIIKGCN